MPWFLASWVGTSSQYPFRRSCTIRGSTFDLLLTDAQLERSQILTLTSTNRRLLVPTKSAVWSVMSRSCWLQWLVYLVVAIGTPWLDLVAPSFRHHHFLPNHTLDLMRCFVLTMPWWWPPWASVHKRFLSAFVRYDDAVVSLSFIHKRETPATQDNHKSKPEPPLKCLAQDHTGQRRPRQKNEWKQTATFA